MRALHALPPRVDAGIAADESSVVPHQPVRIARAGSKVDGHQERAGLAVVLVEHDIGLVERVSNRVLGLVDGRVVAEGAFALVARHPEIAPLVTDG